MKDKPFYTFSVLLIFATILTTTECVREATSDTTAKKNNKAAAANPLLKTNDVSVLLNLVLHEADSIKLAAYRKLINLYEKNLSDERKTQLIPAIIRSSTELLKYYGVIYNCAKVKIMLFKGLKYCSTCLKTKTIVKGQCYKLKALLLEAFFFSHKVEVNNYMRKWLKNASDNAKRELKDDNTMHFMDAKIACEVKLMVQDKNSVVKNLMQLYMGKTNDEQNFDCTTELLKYQSSIKDAGSFPAEYFYLLGRAYAKKGNTSLAMQYLEKARTGHVVDAKTRYTNKQIQQYIEKLYIREHAQV